MSDRKRKLDSWLKAKGLSVDGASKPKTSTRSSGSSGGKRASSPSPKASAPTRKPSRSVVKKKSPPSSSRRPKKTFGKHDPGRGRPSFEKREKFHPTNFFKGPNEGDIRVVPLGGMEQVGQNMMFIEWGNDIVVIDVGLLFPSPEHLGVDILVPNIEYLEKNKQKIRGVIYTHGHLDHIGASPYLLPELGFPPMYATRLTKELLLANAEDEKVRKNYRITEINPTSKIKLGRFEIEFFHINHSIPDGVGVVVKTPYGAVVHTSDFKFDHNPSDEQPCDLGRIGQVGKSGVALAMVDSTNSLREGHTVSESVIEKSLEKVIESTNDRLIITTFASSIGRISKVVEAAEKNGRTVFISGRSMEKNIGIARKLNYLKCKDGTLQRMSKKADKMPGSKVLVLSTGSQGEELAALTRMAAGTHKDITLSPKDTIVFSSSPVPGNELAIVSVLNNLAEIGVKMIDKEQMDIYVSGHGYAEECKLMTTLLNPKYFAPIHGELYMRHGHREMALRDLGFKKENTFIMKNGQGVVLNKQGARLMTEKEALPAGEIMLELGEKLHDHVLGDRTLMADGGVFFITVKHHDGKLKDVVVRARGFRYMDMKHDIFELVRKQVKDTFTRQYDPARPDKALEESIKKSVEKLMFQKFKKDLLVEVVV